MVLDYDYSVNSVRVTRPDTEVRNVRAAVGKVACSGHLSPTLGHSHSTAYSGSGGCGTGYSGLSGGGSRLASKVTSSTYTTSSTVGGGVGGGVGKEYFVKVGGGGASSLGGVTGSLGGVTSSLGGGSRGCSPTFISRQRLISDASQKQHEETATIVTKVIREDTSGMESKIRELSLVTSDLQNALSTLINQSNSDQNATNQRIESFTSATTEIKQSIQELASQISTLSSEIQYISSEVKSCDERIVNIDQSIQSKFSSFQHDMMERDRMIEQIKSDISHRDLVLEDQTKQLRELETCRHSLFHAEEDISNKEQEIVRLNQTIRELGSEVEQHDNQLRHHTEIVSTLERELEHERAHRQEGERELGNLQSTLLTLEQTLNSERQNTQSRERELDTLHQTIEKLEITITEERRTHQTSHDSIQQMQQVVAELEGRLEEERQGKQNSDMELNNIQHQLELIIREKESLEQENGRFKQQSQTDLDSLTQMLERVTQEKQMIEEEGRREKRKSDQLQESMTSLRMILEEEQRKSEEKERKIQNFDRVIKETREMFDLKQSEFNMLKEEIVHYKNLVATKEKELNNLTVVFNQNMTENKHEVTALRQEIKEYKIAIQEKEFRLREYRDREVLQKAVASSESTMTSTNSRVTREHRHVAGGGSVTTGSIGLTSPCRSPSPTLGYCQTHRSIVSLDSRASVGTCGTTCGGNHGILNIRYADPCKKIYPSKDTQLQVTNIYQGKKSSRPIRLCDEKN
ncbi:hypothetical protein ACHWQZ_G010121 [Mnemiopsis leidyi]